jgi:serine/threonine-protein kinase
MPDQPTGDLLAGRYRTVRRLGAGGMAVVLLAQDERLARRVAIKRLHAASAEEAAERFRREARIGAGLNHPNIVSIYDIETDGDDVLIVMEYVEGGTLKDALARGPLQRDTALRVLGDVAVALDYAHRNGVVHRDVKPANILLGKTGSGKLADLGIAAAAEMTSITLTGAVLGTAAYMPPERLDGHPGGPAVDIYALATVAFETLSGHKARSGRTPVEIARQVAAAPPPDIREYIPNAPPGVVDALMRGMARDPAERPATAGELVEQLEAAFANHDATEATRALPPRPPSLGEYRAAKALAGPVGVASAESHAAAKQTAPPPTPPDGPGGAPRRPRRKRWEPPPKKPGGLNRAIAAPGMFGLLVLVAVGIGIAGYQNRGDDKKGSTAAGGQGTTPVQTATTGTGSTTQTQPPATSDANLAPDDVVKAFYERAAKDDFDGAWSLAGDGLRQQLRGRQSFEQTLASLQKIEFVSLKVLSRSPVAAVVSLETLATHPDRVDRCTGTAQLTNDSSGWKIQRIAIAACDSQKPGAAPPSATPGKGPAGGRPVLPGKGPKKDKKKSGD